MLTRSILVKCCTKLDYVSQAYLEVIRVRLQQYCEAVYLREELLKILSAREGEELLMGDIIRVLALFKKLWSSEVRSEVTSLRLTLNEPPVSDEEVRKAIARLKELGIINVEERYRADPSGASKASIKDILVSLKAINDVLFEVYRDKRLHEYQRKRYEAFTLKPP